MKRKRQEMILDLIDKYDLETQEDLIRKLEEVGFKVTQATISRDIKELRLVKSLTGIGKYKYVPPTPSSKFDFSGKFHTLFADAVLNIDCAGHMVCVKCYNGMANAACAALDSMHWDDMVGTLAGDDTIFIAMRNEELAKELTVELKKIF